MISGGAAHLTADNSLLVEISRFLVPLNDFSLEPLAKLQSSSF
jgi:hypothetical protein